MEVNVQVTVLTDLGYERGATAAPLAAVEGQTRPAHAGQLLHAARGGRGGGKVFATRKLCSACLEKLLLNVEVRKKENCGPGLTGSGYRIRP